jgi:hypothetical protein
MNGCSPRATDAKDCSGRSCMRLKVKSPSAVDRLLRAKSFKGLLKELCSIPVRDIIGHVASGWLRGLVRLIGPSGNASKVFRPTFLP